MFDEEPDGDPHGECAAEIARLQELVRWAYSKLHSRTFSTQEDALKLDEMKLLLEHGAYADGMTPELKEAYALLFKAHAIERARWEDPTSVDCASCAHVAPVTVGVCVGCRREDVTVHVNYKRRV